MNRNIGSVVKLKMNLESDILNVIIGYENNSYLSVIYPYGHIFDKVIKFEESDIVEEFHSGYKADN